MSSLGQAHVRFQECHTRISTPTLATKFDQVFEGQLNGPSQNFIFCTSAQFNQVCDDWIGALLSRLFNFVTASTAAQSEPAEEHAVSDPGDRCGVLVRVGEGVSPARVSPDLGDGVGDPAGVGD
ncbi:hypothetical protein CYMTET_21746 [Cymbomonas tetramitiformis]|uniref:Uncharacterized protein n=1 Tax=Cymbomonas tetramitiformis TaxID=36881 RepID=A0AAE0G2R7_9CHLO|nr:hypothetical protein CYMTET_21746 [Cymbomonas tetramitiformis]